MEHGWLVAIAIATLAVAAVVHHAFWVRRLTVLVEYAELDRIPTPDGSAIELRRLGAGGPSAAPPVLMVHGLANTHRGHDPEPGVSLARRLHEEGRDVWLLTLRSGRHDLRCAERKLVRYDAMLRHDLPTALRHVLERTRAPAVDYVGFSMGGMLLYGAVGRFLPAEQLRRVVTIGSPFAVRPPFAALRLLGLLPAFLVPTLRLRVLARMAAFAVDWMPTPLHRLIYNPRNVAPGVTGRAMINAIADVPGALQVDFLGHLAAGGVPLVDGEDPRPRLAGLNVPALFIAGADDRLGRPEQVRTAYEAWGSATGAFKELVVLGRAGGTAEDYGHGDLILGRDVARDVHERVIDFLAAEDELSARPARSE